MHEVKLISLMVKIYGPNRHTDTQTDLTELITHLRMRVVTS